MQHLNDIDFKILAYICEYEPVHIDDIKIEFPKVSSLEYRLSNLSAVKREKVDIGQGAMMVSIPGTSYIVKDKTTNTYKTTFLGKGAVDDYKSNKNKRRADLFWGFLIGVASTVIATLIIQFLIGRQ